MEQQGQLLIPQKTKSYSFTISENVHQRLEHHILLIRRLDERGMTRQRWITEAIQEKLEKERTEETVGPAQRRISIPISERVLEELEKRIQVLKRLYGSASKKQWIAEAIFEKLEREGSKAKGLVQRLRSEAEPTG